MPIECFGLGGHYGLGRCGQVVFIHAATVATAIVDRHDCIVGGQIDGPWEAAKKAQSALDDPHDLMPESPKEILKILGQQNAAQSAVDVNFITNRSRITDR